MVLRLIVLISMALELQNMNENVPRSYGQAPMELRFVALVATILELQDISGKFPES